MRDVLDGTTASGEYEARMGREEFGKEVHVYAPAYTQAEVESLTGIADHIYFNSPEQIARFLPIVKRKPGIEVGIRVNPGYSNATLGGALYDPCAPYSRFGTVKGELDQLPWDGHRHLPRACAVRVAARRLGGADPACGARVRAVPETREGRELRRRALHQQARLRRRRR